MAVIAVGMPTLFPSLRAGPLGPVDPLYEHLRLQQIVEYQPLIPGAWLSAGRFEEIAQRAVRIMGIALAALPFLIVMLARNRPERRAWVALALALVVFLPIACEEVHFGTYAQALLVIPYAACVAWLLGRTATWLAPAIGQLCVPCFWSARCSGPTASPMRCRRPASRPPATTARSTRRHRSSPAWPAAPPRPCSPSPTTRRRCSTTPRSGCSRSPTTGRSPASPRPTAS